MKRISLSDMPNLSCASLLIHIAFHFDDKRASYLFAVLDVIQGYGFSHIDIVIDTNNHKTKGLVKHYKEHLNLSIHVHENLTHPYELTWSHRENVYKNRGSYDYVMYTEDDIEVSWETLQAWRDDSLLLYPLGYLRGFTRIEKADDGDFFYTDYFKRERLCNIVYIGDKFYLKPHNPHQGFWIYSKKMMEDFISSPCWVDGNNSDWEIRERAAAGMMWSDPKSHKQLIPLNAELLVDDIAFVKHLPGNYVVDVDSPFAKIPVNKLFRNKPLVKLVTFYRQAFNSIFQGRLHEDSG